MSKVETVESVVAFFKNNNGEILLGKPKDQSNYPWSLIGGSVDDNESLTHAVSRHALADCGLEINIKSVIAELSGDKYRVIYECGADRVWTATVFSCEISNQGEHSILETCWFPVQEIASLSLDEFSQTALKDLGYLV
jgi:ADP-ribose pyrophosphatase YjhB (NUDIX family)